MFANCVRIHCAPGRAAGRATLSTCVSADERRHEVVSSPAGVCQRMTGTLGGGRHCFDQFIVALLTAAVRAVVARLAQLAAGDEDDLLGVDLADKVVTVVFAPVVEPSVHP